MIFAEPHSNMRFIPDSGPVGAAGGADREPDADAPEDTGVAAEPPGTGPQRPGPEGVDQHTGAGAGPARRH